MHWTGFKPDAFAGGLGEKTLGELDALIGKYVVSRVGFEPTAVSFEVFAGSILFHIERSLSARVPRRNGEMPGVLV